MNDDMTPFERYLATTLEHEPSPPAPSLKTRQRRPSPFLRGRLVVLGLSTAAIASVLGGTAVAVAAAVHLTLPPAAPVVATTPLATPSPSAIRPAATPLPHSTGTAHPTARPHPATPAPTPVPIPPAPSPTAPSPTAVPVISSMTLSPTAFVNNGSNNTMIRWTVTSKAYIDIVLLDSNGNIVAHILTHDTKDPGGRAQGYWGYNGSGKLLPAGIYTVRITATATTGGAVTTLSEQLTLKSS